MRTIELTEDLKSRLNRETFLGEGNEGRVFKYNDNETIKLYHRIFRRLFEDPDHRISTIESEASEMYHDKIIGLELRQNLIRRTKLPKGRVTYRDLTVGSILTYHDNHIPLVMHYFEDDATVLQTFKGINESIRELSTYCIYLTDVHEQNVLIEKGTLFPELIDIDGEYIHLLDTPDESEEIYTYSKMRQLFINYVRLKKSNDPKMSDEEIFETIGIKEPFLSMLLTSDVNADDLEELFEYCLKDKVLEKAPTYRLTHKPNLK